MAGSPTPKTSHLRALLAAEPPVRAIGAGDALTAVLAERCGFETIWASGLAISAAHAVPDASILTMTEFLAAAEAMNLASALPVIADCDTGFGDLNNVVRMVRKYESVGIAAVCIEDKEFPKRNSFVAGAQQLAEVEDFCAKIRAAKAAQDNPDFVVIARLESLIAGAGLDDALRRAVAYCDAGADAVLVHSKSKVPDEVLAFAQAWERRGAPVPLVAVPTMYYSITAEELSHAGIKVVIYANQALRAAVPAITRTLESIAVSGSSAAIEEDLAPVSSILSLIGTDELADANNAPPRGKLRAASAGPSVLERAAP